MSSPVDSVILHDQDDDTAPPTHVLRVYGHPASEHWPRDIVSIEACAYAETTETASLEVLASFGIAVDDLLAALALVLGDNSLVIPPGMCWHDPGVTWPDGFAPRCELRAGHAGAHECDRGSMGGRAIWTDEEGVREAEPAAVSCTCATDSLDRMPLIDGRCPVHSRPCINGAPDAHRATVSWPTLETVDLMLAQLGRDREAPYWIGHPHVSALDGAEAWLLSLRDWVGTKGGGDRG